MEHIRNFCIIAHIDHAKSTLADRLLELTGTLDKREMQEQVLDQMELERERGITIKAKAVRLSYSSPWGQSYQLNLIDTPGHVDFTYEVSRSLAACEGALVVVDATKGVQAQTMANVFIAMEQGLALVPVINKVDLPNAEPDRVAREMGEMLGFPAGDIIRVSAKEGWGVDRVLEAIVRRMPSPSGGAAAPLRALIFDARYDPYKGVVAYVRVKDGSVQPRDALKLMASGAVAEVMGAVTRLFRLIPRQQFDVAMQAAVEGRVIARETIVALRKDVTAKLYGGDVTRKRKLLEKQAEGKKRLKRVGHVDIPREVFFEVLGKG